MARLGRGQPFKPLVETFAQTKHAYSLTASAGSYSITGVAATLSAQRNLTAVSGSYSINGVSVTMPISKTFAADAGSYAITGLDITFSYSQRVGADAGSYGITGNPVTFSTTGVVAAPGDSDGVGGKKTGAGSGKKKKHRQLKLDKPFDELITAKKTKDVRELSELQRILEGRAPEPPNPGSQIERLTQAQKDRIEKRRAEEAANDDADVEFLLLYG